MFPSLSSTHRLLQWYNRQKRDRRRCNSRGIPPQRRLHPEFISVGNTDSDKIKFDKGVTEGFLLVYLTFKINSSAPYISVGVGYILNIYVRRKY